VPQSVGYRMSKKYNWCRVWGADISVGWCYGGWIGQEIESGSVWNLSPVVESDWSRSGEPDRIILQALDGLVPWISNIGNI
jgi:hypothetical protein